MIRSFLRLKTLWFVLVPWNPQYNTQDFCVTKYEVSYGPNERYIYHPGFTRAYVLYNENKTPVSTPNSYALATTQLNAIKTYQIINIIKNPLFGIT